MAALSAAAPVEVDAGILASVDKLTACEDLESCESAAKEVAGLVQNVGSAAICGVMPLIIDLAENKNNLAGVAGIKAIAETLGRLAEPFLAPSVPVLLKLSGSKNTGVRDAATAATPVVVSLLSANITAIIDMIFAGMQVEQNWQTRVVAINCLGTCVKTSPRPLSSCMPQIIPQLTPCMTDTKKQVKGAAKKVFTETLTVVENTDIAGILPSILNSILKPKEVPELMHKLAAVVFVQTVDGPTLSVLVPLLVRGLREKASAVKRQTSVIINNMSKLVENPVESAPFLPLLLPALQKASDMISDPEARNICEKATAQLTRLNKLCIEIGDVSNTDPAIVFGIIQETLPSPPDAVATVVLQYLSSVVAMMIDMRVKDPAEYASTMGPYLSSFLTADQIATCASGSHEKCVKLIKEVPEEPDDEDAGELLADCEFTLAYGTKILLHNTKMKLRRGSKYGLLGGNDSGKTTLMRSIAQEQIEGFPPATELRSVFVEADILGELSHLTCTEYVLADERIQGDGISSKDVRDMLLNVHFSTKMLDDGVSTLSGGWRMKLALARAMLLKADILLLDEPTNHLDVMNVKWVKDYLIGLTNVTAICVSHDSGFLDDVCTHILQIDSLKLNMHKGNLTEFVKKVPEARSYFELKESKLKFTFPQPGPLEGVKSKGKALMKMENVSYRYPINDHFTITGMTVQVSLSSRVGCVGPNGAGKSTMIKCLTGEVEPSEGTRWAHPNLRMAYVAQHAFHHIEEHLAKTPNEYIRWRYAAGDDKEAMNKVTMISTPEEEAAMATPIDWQWKDENEKICKDKRLCEKLTGMRRTAKSKEFEYEIKWRHKDQDQNSFLSRTKLIKMGFEKHCMSTDQKIAMKSGMYIRPLTTNNVEKHLEDVGLDREFGTHYRMNALSGGQKVKVVIGAAMWNQPHVVILDEPTNYLDRESLGALANAIKEYAGGVVIITHNDEFCRAICPERWVIEKMGDGIGRLDTQGDPEWMKHALDQKVVQTAEPTEMIDASGNVTKVKAAPKKLSKKEEKQKKKRLAAKIKNNEPLDSDEEEYAMNVGLL